MMMKRIVTGITILLSFLAAILLRPRTEVTAHRRHEDPRSGALAALDFWTRARAYPDPDIAPDKFYRAFSRSTQQQKDGVESIQSISPWESMGPMNVAGRAISIAINPLNENTIYVGSASGGLWRSYTGGVGTDWQRVITGFPVLGVGAIAIDAADSNTIYIGTGEVYRYQATVGGVVIRTTRGSYGIGILKTTNAGSTWTKSLDWSFHQERGVQALSINPGNSRMLLAATSEGVYKTTDGGQSWYNTLPVPMAVDIVINSADTTRVLATCGNFSSGGSGLYVSNNAGESWSQVGPFPTFSGKAVLEPYARNPNVVYASVADSTTSVSSLWRSDDFGASWTQINSTDVAGVQGWYSHIVAVKPDDSTRVVRAGVSVVHSTDGGATFLLTPTGYADSHSYAHLPSDPNILYVVNDAGISRSTDFGATFSPISQGMQIAQFYNGFSNSSTDSLLALGHMQDCCGLKYTGSISWILPVGVGETGWTAINPLNDWTMFEARDYASDVWRSTDRGNSFSMIATFPAAGSWNSPLIISPSDTTVLYLGSDRVYKSMNGGTGWAPTSTAGFLDGNPSLSMAISYTNPDTLYVGKAPLGARAHIFRTTSGGTTWTDVTGTLPDRYPLDLAVDPNNSRIVYVALGGANSGHLFKSTDAGGSWSDVTGSLPDIPTTAVVVDPMNSNSVYAGNDIGVYASTNAGTSWNWFSDGLPEAVLISDLTISPSNRMLRATTHGNGVYQRRIPSALPALRLTSPIGGEQWDATSVHSITWSEGLVTAVKLEYSTDAGATWLSIAGSVPAFPEMYAWHVPYTPSTKVRVRVTSIADSTLRVQSGSDFAITFHGSELHAASNWNLISLPVRAGDARKTTLFPTASSPAFDYQGSYRVRDTLSAGPGYWLRFQSSQVIPLLGDSIDADTIPVSAGWNLIGSISSPVAASAVSSSPPGIVVSRYFGYSAGYYSIDSINPGEGNWVKTSSSGQLILSQTTGAQSTAALPHLAKADELSSLNELTISDASGSKQTLYFGIDAAGLDAARYEMPPVPPAGVFDARFASQQTVELFDGKKSADLPILVSGGNGPFSIGWHIRQASATLIVDGKEIALSSDGSVQLAGDPSSGNPMRRIRLILSPALVTETPKEFSLDQNYPNPFNPATEVRYEVPVQSRVQLTVYDLLGREVATLVDGVIPAGRYTARWDASGVPSGIYFYRLTAGTFTGTRKMALIR